jgi:hypothetical protein
MMMGKTMFRSSLMLLALFLALAPGPGRAADPAVARPSFPIDGEIQTKGTVFFVKAPGPAGAAAVGTAHTFDLGKLARVKRGELLLGNSRRMAAKTSGFLVPPGRPFNEPGAGLADDFVVYALDAPPQGVRLLTLSSGTVRPGMRVRLLGIPPGMTHDEDDLFGRVAEASPQRIEVDLDVTYDLRGWGGAPVLDEGSGRVIGTLQAHYPQGSKSRVTVAPITKLREAMESPIDGGAGRPFAAFDNSRGRAGSGGVQTHRTPPPLPRDAGRGRAGTVGGRYERADGPLIKQAPQDGTRVHVDIEYPPDGAIVGDGACGSFVSGRAIALHGEMRRFDVMLVLDTSRSTIDPTGADINGNGIVGKPYLGRIGSIFDVGSTDPGDSILAAEVAAARQLLRGFDPRSTRVGVVVFSGDPPDTQSGIFMRGQRAPAITLEPLSDDYTSIARALDDILARDPQGSTHMAAGVDQATIELMGLRGALSRMDPRSEKVVLFFTDGQPTLPYGPGFEADNVRAVLRAANRAGRAEIRIHSFAIGPDALEGPVATVEMASRTDGFFTPVRHPGDLVDLVEEVSFANLQDVTVESLTTGEPIELLRTTADGSWAGFLRLQPGKNKIRVHATATDATEAEQTIEITMAKDAPDPPIPSGLVVARNRLLEDCLRSIKQVRMDAERERAEQVRKALKVEIEKERRQARARAEQQRKALQLEVGTDE